MAALFSWKRLSNLSPGIQCMFFNSKLPKLVHMPQMAGNTTVLVEQTNYHCPSLVVQMLLTDLFLEFLLSYKGTANFKQTKHRFVPMISKLFQIDIFWTELSRTLQLLFGHFLWHKCKIFLAVLLFGSFYTTASFRWLHVFPKFTLHK